MWISIIKWHHNSKMVDKTWVQAEITGDNNCGNASTQVKTMWQEGKGNTAAIIRRGVGYRDTDEDIKFGEATTSAGNLTEVGMVLETNIFKANQETLCINIFTRQLQSVLPASAGPNSQDVDVRPSIMLEWSRLNDCLGTCICTIYALFSGIMSYFVAHFHQ